MLRGGPVNRKRYVASMNSCMADHGTLSTVASIVSGFGVAMLFFRIQRELHMKDRHEQDWIPKSDLLLIAATLISLLFVILPIVSLNVEHTQLLRIPAAACAATAVLVSGYIFSILAHYRLLFGRGRSGRRVNPEPAERVLIILTILIAIAVFTAVFLTRRPATIMNRWTRAAGACFVT